MDLPAFEKQKKPFTFEKKTVLTTIFIFIAVYQNIELWIIKLRFIKLISLQQRHQRRFRLLSKPPLQQYNNKKKLNFTFSRLQRPSRFFIFVLILTPANSVEISNNKHFVSRCTIKFNELFDDFIILFNTGVIGKIFVDTKYAQQQRIFSIILIRFIPLQGFDDNVTSSWPMIYFIYIFFVLFGHKLQFTRFFLIDVFQFFILINLPRMKINLPLSNWNLIFQPSISNNQIKQMNHIEISETNPLTKTGKFTRFPHKKTIINQIRQL